MKYLNANWKKWISPNQLKNYIYDDPILDWLKLYGNEKKDIIKNNDINYNKYIYDLSIKYKQSVIYNLINRFKKDCVKICDNNELKSTDKFIKTKMFMKKGKPIIINGLLHNYKKKLYSIPDLIIRSDYIELLYDIIPDIYINNITGCIFSSKWHYVVINIKYCSMYLHKNNRTIQNKTSTKLIKSKTIFDNMLLGEIQKYTPELSFIHSYKIKLKNEFHNGFYKLGEIDIINNDKIINDKIYSGIIWLNKLWRNGRRWKIGITPELFPNMCNKKDNPFHNAKKKIAVKLNEITLIWNISYSQRMLYHSKGIFSFKNIKNHPNTIINNMIQINSSNTQHQILNTEIINNKTNEILNNKLQNKTNEIHNNINSKIKNIIKNKIPSNIKKLYIDFETTTLIDEKFNKTKFHKINKKTYNTRSKNNKKINLNDINEIKCNNEMIDINEIKYNNKCNKRLNSDVFLYMIGIGWINDSGIWEYINITVDRLDYVNEKIIIKKFIKIINKFPKNILIHWSKAEPIIMNKIMVRHNINYDFNWFDLYDIYKNNKIVIKGCYSYGLKDVAKQLYKLKLINTKWVDENISALDAIIVPLNAEKLCKNNIINSIYNYKYMNDIILYNEIDCKILWKLLFK